LSYRPIFSRTLRHVKKNYPLFSFLFCNKHRAGKNFEKKIVLMVDPKISFLGKFIQKKIRKICVQLLQP
jgi:hypothetical protein